MCGNYLNKKWPNSSIHILHEYSAFVNESYPEMEILSGEVWQQALFNLTTTLIFMATRPWLLEWNTVKKVACNGAQVTWACLTHIGTSQLTSDYCFSLYVNEFCYMSPYINFSLRAQTAWRNKRAYTKEIITCTHTHTNWHYSKRSTF